jgi:hypothetical protein
VSTPGATPLAIRAGSSEASAPVAPPLASNLTFVFPGNVHEIQVVKCGSTSSTIDDWCTCDATSVAWLTGAGEWDWALDEADEPRQHAPTIASGVHYGVQPPGAGYESDPEPLSDGRYCVHASVFGQCDQGYGLAECIHTERHGSNYFDVVGGTVIKP